jgi:glucosamine--fructose-6-phosphate aminotransferase (isomerizing)
LVISDKIIEKANWSIQIPQTLEILMPYLTVLVSQLLSYYVALELGRDIDKPRNLAKSVTVK